MFGTDIVTDWVNGRNLIVNGDVIWGGIMVVLPFLPMTVALLWISFLGLNNKDNWWKGLLLLIFLLPASVLGTFVYMGAVLLDALAKLHSPLTSVMPVVKEEEGTWMMLGGLEIWAFKWWPVLLRMVEVVGESYPQTLLGELLQSTSPYSLPKS